MECMLCIHVFCAMQLNCYCYLQRIPDDFKYNANNRQLDCAGQSHLQFSELFLTIANESNKSSWNKFTLQAIRIAPYKCNENYKSYFFRYFLKKRRSLLNKHKKSRLNANLPERMIRSAEKKGVSIFCKRCVHVPSLRYRVTILNSCIHIFQLKCLR